MPVAAEASWRTSSHVAPSNAFSATSTWVLMSRSWPSESTLPPVKACGSLSNGSPSARASAGWARWSTGSYSSAARGSRSAVSRGAPGSWAVNGVA